MAEEASGPAARRHERILAIAAAAWRAGAALLLIYPLTTFTGGANVVFLLVSAIVYSVVSATWHLLSRSVTRAQACLDVAVYAALFAVAPLWREPAVSQAMGSIYGYVLYSAMVIGLAPWPWWVAAVLGVCLSLTYAATVITPDRWNVPPDAMNLTLNVVLAWIVAATARAAARQLDRSRRLAVDEAAEVGRVNQHAAYSLALRARVLATIERIGDDDIADERLRRQLQRDAAWLRAHVESPDEQPRDGVVALLRQAVEQKRKEGMQIALSLLSDLEELPMISQPAATAAIVATTEALANVGKHSGRRRATVSVFRDGAGLTITVADEGAGFDPDVAASGVGLRDCVRAPVAEAGGRADVISYPGQGTVVVLHFPVAA